jgi:hypothetical protein
MVLNNHRNKGTIKNLNTLVNDSLLSCPGTGISIKSGGLKAGKMSIKNFFQNMASSQCSTTAVFNVFDDYMHMLIYHLLVLFICYLSSV